MLSINPDTAINFSHLRQYVGEDTELTAEVFGLFKHQTEMWSKALSAGADDETWVSVAHSLKGSARAVGACGLADACDSAESLIGDAASKTARVIAVQDIQNWIEAVLHRIQRWEYRQSIENIRNS